MKNTSNTSKNMSNISPNAITTPDYWEGNWAHIDVPEAINPGNDAPENHYYQVMHKYFVGALGERCVPGARLIEIGCGGSSWLPYFNRTFGYEVSGIDYTVTGTRLSKLILDKAGVSGKIVQGDLFDPPPNWIERFDVVISFGLVEHFENTSDVVYACSRYLRPGGQMITLVPTMRGLYGLAYRLLRPEVYRKHIPQNQLSLAQAHTNSGLKVVCCDYVLGLPGVLKSPASLSLLSRLTFAVSQLYWRLERSGLGIPPNRFTSPYALCISTKLTST
jgi:2-polyprenyl-3-methyl-5-hydroxy-6-metoxy-1,4-benzoquinol methylase